MRILCCKVFLSFESMSSNSWMWFGNFWEKPYLLMHGKNLSILFADSYKCLPNCICWTWLCLYSLLINWVSSCSAGEVNHKCDFIEWYSSFSFDIGLPWSHAFFFLLMTFINFISNFLHYFALPGRVFLA